MDLIVLFGSMLRKWKPQNIDEMYISPQYRHRQVGKTNWWHNNRRILRPGAEKWETAYPPGHEILNKEVEDE